jgi:hypothetical protein
MKRIRTVFYMDAKDRKAFEKMSNETGAAISELLRRAVAFYVSKKLK